MRIRKGFHLEDKGNGTWIARAEESLAAEYPNAFYLGLTGAYLWEQLTQRDCSRVELVLALEQLFDTEVPEGALERDVDTLITFLQENNILE